MIFESLPFFVVREFYKFIFEKLLMGVINFYDSLKRSTGSSIIKLYVLFNKYYKRGNLLWKDLRVLIFIILWV